MYLDFLKLAQNGNPMLSIIGEQLEWQCRDIGPGMPLPYTSDGDSLMVSTTYYFCTDEMFALFYLFCDSLTLFTMTEVVSKTGKAIKNYFTIWFTHHKCC